MSEYPSDSAVLAFAKAVARLDRGQSELAKLIGKSQGAISKRLRSAKPIWAEDVLAVEAATGVSRHELRPDIYSPEEYAASPTTGAGPAVAPPVPALAGGAPVSPSDGAPA